MLRAAVGDSDAVDSDTGTAAGVSGDAFGVMKGEGDKFSVWSTAEIGSDALREVGCGDPGGETSYKSSKSGDTGLELRPGGSFSRDIAAEVSVVESLTERGNGKRSLLDSREGEVELTDAKVRDLCRLFPSSPGKSAFGKRC